MNYYISHCRLQFDFKVFFLQSWLPMAITKEPNHLCYFSHRWWSNSFMLQIQALAIFEKKIAKAWIWNWFIDSIFCTHKHYTTVLYERVISKSNYCLPHLKADLWPLYSLSALFRSVSISLANRVILAT